MAVYRVDVAPDPQDVHARRQAEALAVRLAEVGLQGVHAVREARVYFLEGSLTRDDATVIAESLLSDPVQELASVRGETDPPPADAIAIEVHPRPGVMDPVAQTTLEELAAEGFAVERVRTARRFIIEGSARRETVERAAQRALANDSVDELVFGAAAVRPAPLPPIYEYRLRRVELTRLDDAALQKLSRSGHLFLSLAEMRAVQEHFRALQREPTDLELETLAQTWSEHCVHKTLKSAVIYRGEPMPGRDAAGETRYGNLLKETIARATSELMAARRGPECLSVFQDNAGIIGFDERYGVAFKVETHNHPSAIEPYGGAATGAGGCIRDVIGCGLGALPIANTDVFCVAPGDWPHERLPKGVLHPGRVLRGVVQGVADYGNRMGIPTVNGAVQIEPRYLGNPLVFCGCVGLIPRSMIQKDARVGDKIVVVGGRTGRDGVHGATFSSAELSDTHADEFSHAVQIGNAITEKRMLDAILHARDAAGGCLYSAITDCGAGGLSSAVGEMGAKTGAVVDLEHAPLKYAGLRYDEIWISESQERMVVSVPDANLPRFLEIMREEQVEAAVLGEFRSLAATPQLTVRYNGAVVGELDMHFLHEGLPRSERAATWTRPARVSAPCHATAPTIRGLLEALRNPRTLGRDWIIRSYDHEVQGGSVVKPRGGPGDGPQDAAVLRPRLDATGGIAVGCGLRPDLFDVDPYWMAAAAIDEAVRNVVAVGGDPRRTALLDNFCWGRCDDPEQMGGLVRACQACYDFAIAYGTPFISGKDSLNNEFALDAADVEPLLEQMRAWYGDDDRGVARFAAIAERTRRTGRLSIPGTLLISAVSLIDDVRHCLTTDLKAGGSALLLVGGLDPCAFDPAAAFAVHEAVADANRAALLRACHDVSDGGWLTALAEMAIGGVRGVDVNPEPDTPRAARDLAAAYVIEAPDAAAATAHFRSRGVRVSRLGQTRTDNRFVLGSESTTVAALGQAWRGG